MSVYSLRSAAIIENYPEVKYYLEKIIACLHPQKVILFGSKAKGTVQKGSDTDMAVITDNFFDTTEIYGAVDIVDFKRASEKLQEKILEEGIILYEK